MKGHKGSTGFLMARDTTESAKKGEVKGTLAVFKSDSSKKPKCDVTAAKKKKRYRSSLEIKCIYSNRMDLWEMESEGIIYIYVIKKKKKFLPVA